MMLPTPIADILICLRFFSRLPLPLTARETALGARGLARAVAMVPVAGAILGAVAAAVLGLAIKLGLPASTAAPLAIASLVAVTGALHEDGLADCADGFGGGRTRERKLEIMRDSRIGTYGACAIGLSLYLRGTSLAAIAGHGTVLASAVLIAGAAVSRTLCLMPLVLLEPARADGAGASVGRLAAAGLPLAVGLALAAGLLPWGAGSSLARAVVATCLGLASAAAVSALARRHVGGHTGDVAGAAQQAVEVTMLIVYAALPP